MFFKDKEKLMQRGSRAKLKALLQSKFDRRGSVLFLGEPVDLNPQGTLLMTALNGWET